MSKKEDLLMHISVEDAINIKNNYNSNTFMDKIYAKMEDWPKWKKRIYNDKFATGSTSAKFLEIEED